MGTQWDPREKTTVSRVPTESKPRVAVLYAVGILDVIPDRLRRYREPGSFEPDAVTTTATSSNPVARALLFFAVTNRSLPFRPITYRGTHPDNKDCRRAEKRERGSDLPRARHRRAGPHRAFHSFRTMRRVFPSASETGKFARFISARAKIHVRDTSRGSRDGRHERYRASARIYAVLDGIDIASNDGVS